jgi:hypothetical protein
MAEDYVEVATRMVLQTQPLDSSNGNGTTPLEDADTFPLEARSTLAYLKNPARRPTILETWCPLEVALFEAALGEYGKQFHFVSKEITTKTTKQIVEFYYIWKKTKHYQNWKNTYLPEYLDHSDEEQGGEEENENENETSKKNKSVGVG